MYHVYLIPLGIAVFLALNMGASGTAPSFSPAYGADLLRRDLIPGLFGTFVLIGAIVAGQKVVRTIGGSIIPAAEMTVVLVSVVLLSAALSVFAANLLRVPQSTSQSTVFALVGAGLATGHFTPQKLIFEIIPTWFILPVVAFVLTYGFARFVYRPIRERGVVNFSGLAGHPAWRALTIVCCCYVAFSIGSNNVANAAGPVAAMMMQELSVAHGDSGAVLLMALATLLIAPWFGIGSSLMGVRVIRTTGKQLVEFGPLAAAFIATLTATLLLLASLSRGIPTSLVQLNTAAIFAIGCVRTGPRAMLRETAARRVLAVWLVAPIVAFLAALAMTLAAQRVGVLWSSR